MINRVRFYAQFLCILLALSVSGCGPALGKPVLVEGRVTMDGKGLANVDVAFAAIEGELPGDKRSASGKTDSTGVYQIEKLYPAEYQVSITDPAVATTATVAGAGPGQPGLVLANPGADTPLARYQPGSSPLKAHVTEEATNFDFELKSDGSSPPAK